jgi:hypothetical protein
MGSRSSSGGKIKKLSESQNGNERKAREHVLEKKAGHLEQMEKIRKKSNNTPSIQHSDLFSRNESSLALSQTAAKHASIFAPTKYSNALPIATKTRRRNQRKTKS